MTPTLEQLLRVPRLDSGYGFDISPDGRQLIFSWNKSGQWELYASQFPSPDFGRGGSGEGEVYAVTLGPGGKFAPRFSPDGARLAYALDRDGSESYHIAVYDFAARQHTDLTPNISHAHQPNIGWSPDGSQLAVLSDSHGGQFALYLISATEINSTPKLLLDINHPCWDARWSPTGDWIAVEVEWHGQDRSIFLVNLHNGERRQLRDNGVILNAMHPAWSPDGHTLAFCADPSGWHCIGLYDVATQNIQWLDAGEGDETSPAWSTDGNKIACVYTKGADTAIRVHDLQINTVQTYRVAPGIHSHPQFSRDDQSLYFIFENPRHPDDLWQLDLASGAFTQLTNSLPDDIDTSDFIIPEEVWYPSVDGVMVPAMLYRPGENNAPALINIHGGPNWLYQCNWHPLMSYLAVQGWAVLAPNYRGSTNYGRAWAQANHMRLGEVDTFDCAAGAQYLIRAGWADPHKITLTGRSHGGYLVMTCLTEYPDLWAGGSAVVPFMNWFTCHANARDDLKHWDVENLGDPIINADLWRRRSPFFYLDRINAPVQLICGAHDPRCPASESVDARDRLQELGRSVELLLYDDEGHGFLKIENVIDHEIRRLEFLETMVVE